MTEEATAESMLHVKLALIRSSFGAIEKTGTNRGVGDGYKFVEASQVASRFLELAGEQGVTMVCISQDVKDIRPTPSGKQFVYTLWTQWLITDSVSGESLIVEAFGQGADNGDKALPKAQTNAMKYAILLLLQRAGDDPEADGRTDQIEAGTHAAEAQARTAARRGARQQPADAPFEGGPAPVPPAEQAAINAVTATTPPMVGPTGVPSLNAETTGVAKASEAKRKAIRGRGHEVGLDDTRLKALSTFLVGEKSSKDWTDREADKILANLEKPDVVSMFREAVAVGEAVQAS